MRSKFSDENRFKKPTKELETYVPNVVTETFKTWKRGDRAYFKDFAEEWRFGEFMYHCFAPSTGKEWITFWDLTHGGFYSCYISEIYEQPANKKVQRDLAKAEKKLLGKKSEKK